MKDFKILTINTTNPEKTAILLAARCHSESWTKNPPNQKKRSFAAIQDDIKILDKKTWKAKTHQSEELLPAVDKLLHKNKIKTENLGLIIVNVGPGSFTGTRVGVATANALSFGLGIPVVDVRNKEKIEDILPAGLKLFEKEKIKKGVLAKPFYDKAPNITISKKIK